jgi:4-azaleucine resistance transporter AzlC
MFHAATGRNQKNSFWGKIMLQMFPNHSNRSLAWAGARATLPLITSVAPFGMLFGALGVASGISARLTMSMSPLIFAGSAQFLGMQLIGSGAPPFILLLTTLVVNLRHVLYGISIGPHMKSLSKGWKWLLAYFLTDEVYAVSISRFNQGDISSLPNRYWFYVGSGLTLWLSWQASTAVGLFFGSQIPASWGLDFAIALTFIALVVPALADRAAVLAALVGGAAAVLLAGLPLKLGLIAAALVGILAGMALDLEWVFRKSSHD